MTIKLNTRFLALLLVVMTMWSAIPSAMADKHRDVTQEEINLLYDGSWIQYGVYTYRHVYVLTRIPTNVYGDSSLKTSSLIYTITDAKTPLLAVEHYRCGNTRGVMVWLYAVDGTALLGYVKETDLVNAFYTDSDAKSWTKRRASYWMNIEGKRMRVFETNGYTPR